MANAVPSSQILVPLTMEAPCSSKTSVLTGATWRNIPEDSILHSHHHENLKLHHLPLFLDCPCISTTATPTASLLYTLHKLLQHMPNLTQDFTLHSTSPTNSQQLFTGYSLHSTCTDNTDNTTPITSPIVGREGVVANV
jgi:hypothetical protein